MTKIRNIAISIVVAVIVLPGHGLASNANRCTHSAAEYTQAIRHFEGQVARVRTAAVANPLYESDVAYYASVLADARTCLRTLAPIATASR